MSVPVCYYGSPEPLPPRRELRAGPLTAIYEAGDLRYVRAGGVEVCRRWYAAVRDHNWGTVPLRITEEHIANHIDQFEVRYRAEHRAGDVHFVWVATITGWPDGVDAVVRFEFDGEAKTTFRRNRIGFCVLHPPETCAGRKVALVHPGGPIEQDVFPHRIAPQNPFKELTGLRHELPGGGFADWRFEGDVFETEDQRNWIDASFKTFCTPLRLPFPVEVEAGERVRQVVTLRVTGVPDAASVPAGRATFTVSPETRTTMPAIGLGAASHGEPLTKREVERLRRLRPAHIRLEHDIRSQDWERFHRVSREAEALGATLELALLVGDESPGDDLDGLERLLQEMAPPVGRAMVHYADRWAVTDRDAAVAMANRLATYFPGLPAFTGTRANFTELNRGRPPVDLFEGVCYSVQPQEHAFDNASLVECCAAIADTARSAKAFAGGLPIAVGPITLRKRVNPYATGPAPPVPPGELPPTVDPRQVSLFGAGWTLGALKYLAESGVAAATFYETTGWLGVMEREDGCPLPEKFRSRPGMLFPLYYVLSDAAMYPGARVLSARSSDPLAFDGLAVRRANHVRVMLANLSNRPLDVRVDGLHGFASIRTLDEMTFDAATSQPEEYITGRVGTEYRPTTDGGLDLTLRPYAYACIDCH